MSAVLRRDCNARNPEQYAALLRPTQLPHRIANRIRAVDMAERGANFLEVFEMFHQQGFEEAESFSLASRIFRGSTLEGGPFTKDLSYSKGFIQTYNYIRLAVRRGMLDRIPLLFCGKTILEDMRTLANLVEEGIVMPPKYLHRSLPTLMQ